MMKTTKKDKQDIMENTIGGDFVLQATMDGLLPALIPGATSMSVRMEYMGDQTTLAMSDQLYG